MFTGIVETLGLIKNIQTEGTSKRFLIEAAISGELKIDQSLCHNGVCLTVVDIKDGCYEVQVVQETLNRSNLGDLKVGDTVNLERSLKVGDRLDGHFVYGHVDQTAICTDVEDLNGSWHFAFEYDTDSGNITVEKGSICINGVSLTVTDSRPGYIAVAIIPYTFDNTTFSSLKSGDKVNLEFDIIGKYIAEKALQ